jgi:tetratricopeptide (TPR) repeat protein
MAQAMDNLRLELEVRAQLVYGYRYAHDGPRSSVHAEKMVERIAELPEPAKSELTAKYQISFDQVLAYTYAGNVRRALPLAREAHDAARRSGEPMDLAVALNGLIVLYFAWGRHADAVKVGREIDQIWRPGYNDGIAYSKNLFGMSYYLLGDYPAAVSKLADARTTADEWDSPRPEALSLWNLSLIHTLHGVYDKGLECGREAEALMMRLGLDRAAHAPHMAAEAALKNDHAGLVRALLQAAEEWTTCGDLFPGNELAKRAGQIARRYELDDLASQADALAERLTARLQLPDPQA